MADTTAQKVQDYKDSLKTKAEQLLLKGFPEKIVELNELLETPGFCNRKLSDVHQDLNVPIPDPILLNHSEDESCNKPLCDLIHIVKPYIRQLLEDSNLVGIFQRVEVCENPKTSSRVPNCISRFENIRIPKSFKSLNHTFMVLKIRNHTRVPDLFEFSYISSHISSHKSQHGENALS